MVTLKFRPRDTSVPQNGPGGKDCGPGNPVDGAEFDRQFTCDCSTTKYTGANCATHASSGDSTLINAVVVVLCFLLLVGAAVAANQKRLARMKANAPVSFEEQLQRLKDAGLIDLEQVGPALPRELKRAWVSLIEMLGHGNFGEVWKGILLDGANRDVPEYLCAVKTVLEPKGGESAGQAAAAENDLLNEALLMAQVGQHKHLVSLIGVVTRGKPKMLLLSYCEHGDLQSTLKTHVANGTPLVLATKYQFCWEIADGMQYLAAHALVHRDLAARNVLLASGMVCKVADFGLSRSVQKDDGSGDYYRSSGGNLPVRWTAPEGLSDFKFSSASDVWSFGITCVEIFQDGLLPYPDARSNPSLMALVVAGEVHLQPSGCPGEVYGVLLRCWEFKAAARTTFGDLCTFFERLTDECGLASTVAVAVQRRATVLHPRFFSEETAVGGGASGGGGSNVAQAREEYVELSVDAGATQGAQRATAAATTQAQHRTRVLAARALAARPSMRPEDPANPHGGTFLVDGNFNQYAELLGPDAEPGAGDATATPPTFFRLYSEVTPVPGTLAPGVSWALSSAAADDGLAERFDVTPRVTPRITPTDPRELKLEESSV